MTISTIKASGGNYSSLSAWEAAQLAVLVAPAEAECYNFALSDNVAITGITTTATNYIRFYTPLSQRFDGRSRAVSGTGFRISDSTGSGTIRLGSINFFRIEGLEIEQTGANNALQLMATIVGTNDIRIQQNIIHDTQTGTGYTIGAFGSGLNLTFQNNIVYGFQRSWDTRGASSVTAQGNTFWRHNPELGLVSGTELVCNNTYSGHTGAASDDFWSGGSPTGNNNASSDTSATARFSASVNSIAGSSVLTSVTPGAEDFRLLSGTNALVEAGANLGTLLIDIIGTSRPQGTFSDIGAFERITASGSSGTLASTNVNDTAAASGTAGIVVSGSANIQIGNDTSTSTGKTTIVGIGSYTNTNDTIVAIGKTTITGIASIFNIGDLMSAAGWAGIITGTLARLNRNDTMSAQGSAGGVIINGSISTRNGVSGITSGINTKDGVSLGQTVNMDG